MSLKRTVVLLLFFTLGLGMNLRAETPESSGDSNSHAAEPFEASKVDLEALREFHEGARFLLQRFATVEALISAVDRGRQENQAFLIGAASWIPGAGQMINGDYLTGSLLLFSDSLSGVTANQLGYTRGVKRHGDMGVEYQGLVFLRDGIMTYATLHAANASYREHHDRTAAMWTGMASLIPGAGQAVNGNWWEAGGLLVAWAVCAALTTEMERRSLPGHEPMTAEGGNESQWRLAWLPGGAGLVYSQTW